MASIIVELPEKVILKIEAISNETHKDKEAVIAELVENALEKYEEEVDIPSVHDRVVSFLKESFEDSDYNPLPEEAARDFDEITEKVRLEP